jgi:hypothetical protein
LAAAFQVKFPDRAKALMLPEGAKLSQEGEQNARSMAKGSWDYGEVMKALTAMDVTKSPTTTTSAPASGKTYAAALEDEDDDSEDDQADEGLTASDIEVLVAELAEQELDELEIAETWAALEEKKRRTWKEGKAIKREMKKNRKFYGVEDKSGARPARRRQMPIDELEKISKCTNCGEQGHWHKERTKPHRPKP